MIPSHASLPAEEIARIVRESLRGKKSTLDIMREIAESRRRGEERLIAENPDWPIRMFTRSVG